MRNGIEARMRLLGRVRRRVRALLRKPELDREMDEEMRLHLALEAEDLIRRGVAPEEARRRALVAFGGVERHREAGRDARGVGVLEDTWMDLRLAARSLRRSPVFTAVAVLTLTLGIGATTAIFSVVDGVLLKPLPYREPDGLVAVWGRFLPESGFDFPEFPLSAPEYFDYRLESRALADVAAFRGFGASILAVDGEPMRVRGGEATANLFGVLGVRPALGRTYTVAEDVPDGRSVVVLSDALWRGAYGADPGIVGRTIRLNGKPAEVIGVMPRGFSTPGPERDLWVPLGLDRARDTNRKSHSLSAVGRLRPGVELSEARAELEALMARWKADYPDIHTGHFLFVRPLLEDVVGGARRTLLVLLGAVALVLAIVCANVANLLLARREYREREVAVRTALGARRLRLVRHFVAEGLVLSAVGGAAGLALAHLAVRAMVKLGAASIPRAGNVHVDARVLLFVAVVAVATALVFALVPVLQSGAVEPQGSLRSGGRGATGGRAAARFRGGLVVAQVALAFVLVIGAGLMMRSLGALLRVDPGFRTGSVLVARIGLPGGDYPDGDAVVAFQERLRERLAALPGVHSASALSSLPLLDGIGNADFEIEGRAPASVGEPARSGYWNQVMPDLLETLRIGLVRGRFFGPEDRADGRLVAVIGETTARMFWPGEDPIGKRLRAAGGDGSAPWLTIVGVVRDVRYDALDEAPRPTWYIPESQSVRAMGEPARTMTYALRTDGDPAALAPAVRRVLRELDPTLPIARMEPLEQVVSESLARPRFTAALLGLFAGLALLLGSVGLYGVLSYAVARRTRELGVRVALGAGYGRVARLVLRQGLGLTAAGLLLGAVAALAATRLMSGLLFQVQPSDPATFAVVAGTMALVALAACLAPAWRAARVDPTEALRTE